MIDQNPPDWEQPLNRWRVKSLRTKAYLVQIALGAVLIYWVVEGAFILVYKNETSLPAKAIDIISSAELLYPWLLLATGVMFLIWSYSAHSNLKLFDRRGIRHSDQATIWWWLVPFAWFVMPFRVVHETARGSVAPIDDLHWNDLDSPSVARWWAGLFVTGLFASVIGGNMIQSAPTVEELDSAVNVMMVGSLLMMAASATAIGLIQVVTGGQVYLANQRWPARSNSPLETGPPAGHGSYQPPSHTG